MEKRVKSAALASTSAPHGPAGLTTIRLAVPVENEDVVLDHLWQYGPTAITEDPGASAVTFTAAYEPDTRLAALTETLEALGARLEPVDQTIDWVATWRAAARPVAVGPFVIRLPEHDPVGAAIDIAIDPGLTFGFAHATTTLALELLARVEICAGRGLRVADVGCGSGILAVAAAQRGAAVVHAVDIDPAAVRTAEANVARNGPPITCTVGSVEVLLPRTYSLVMANLTAATLGELRAGLMALLEPGGELILSGILDEQVSHIAEWFAQLDRVDHVSDGEWVALRLRRRLEERAGASQDPAL